MALLQKHSFLFSLMIAIGVICCPMLTLSVNFTKNSQFYEKQNFTKGTFSVNTTGNMVYKGGGEYIEFDTWFNFESIHENHVYGTLVSTEGTVNFKDFNTPIVPFYREKVEFYHLRNAFVFNRWVIFMENGDNLYLCNNPCRGYSLDKNEKQIVADRSYKYAVFIPYYWPETFGHWINDGLCGILQMPKWVWDLDPVLLYVKSTETTPEHMKVIGLGDVPLIYNHQYTFVEHLFLCKETDAWNGFGISSFPIMKQKFSDYYHLDKVIPTQYAFLNRKQGQARYFFNMEEIINATREATGLDWYLAKMNYKEREETAKLFASFKILGIPGGSIGFNVYYMHDFTGVVPLMGQSLDLPQIHITYCCNVWCICVIHPKMPHKGASSPQNGNGNITRITQAIKMMIYTVNNKQFPSTNLFNVYNLQYLQDLYLMYGDEWKLDTNDATTVLPDMFQNYLDNINQTTDLTKLKKLNIL